MALQQSRRSFIKGSSAAGVGLIMASGIPASLSANTAIAAKPVVLGGGKSIIAEWPKWPMWNPDTDEKTVLESLRSGVWSRKGLVDSFEKEFANLIGAKRCLTVVNGTNSLIVSLIQSNIGPGDEVIIPVYTFIATAQAVIATGAMPVFVDTNPETFQIDTSKIESAVTTRTRAIVPVHLAGMPCDMTEIMAIAKKHNLLVIEDACQAHLAEINHRKVGTIGNAGCFSFQNSKNFPIGEGGAIVSDDEAFMDRCFSYHNLGNPFGSVIGTVGAGSLISGNKLRLTEYQAAIGHVQMKRLESQTLLRTENAEYLAAKLRSIPGIIPMGKSPGVTRAVYHLFPFRYKKEEFSGLSRDAFMHALEAEGAPCYAGYARLNTMPFLSNAFKTKIYTRSYSKKTLNYDKYMEQHKCPQNDILCNEESVWFNQNMFLTDKSAMDGIYSAIEKIHSNAEKIKAQSKI